MNEAKPPDLGRPVIGLGWQCPLCLTVYAPHVASCACRVLGPTTTGVTTTTTWTWPELTPLKRSGDR